MSLAWISIGALVLTVGLSCTTAINVGIVALGMAWLVGVYLGGMSLDVVLQGFPTTLLVTLVGVTLLFSIADCNGTLSRVTAVAVRICRGNVGLLPIMFFGLGLFVATIGPGGTPASALLAPPAMAVAGSVGISPLLMAVMTGNGALAGTLSPFAPGGIVANGVMARIGLGGVEWQTYGYNVLAHAIVAFGGFVVLGGLALFKRPNVSVGRSDDSATPMERQHWLTIGGIAVLIAGVTGLGTHVGMTALVIAAALILLRTVEEQKAILRMPWSVILMVTGVTVLVSLVERTQGMELFTAGLASVSTPQSVVPIVAFGSGLVSVYSSTSGVVMPAFLPMAPELAERVGGLEPLRLAWSVTVGGGLVDLSSLSTVGALYLAAAPPGTDTRRLFNALLVWGLSMTVVGAGLCWLLFGVM
jgi:di/tricarboxylate transporter